MTSLLARHARRWIDRFAGRPGPVPTRDQLANEAVRHLAGIALVLLAAEVVHRTGHSDQQWQYVAIAVALVPQVLLDLLATADSDRRAKLRTSGRPAFVPLLAAAALAVAAPTSFLAGGAPAVAVAALAAAAGLGIAAAPVTVTIASRRRLG